ncbi:MAG TPA: sulfite oxidase [Candidatus Saccharimonadales bacterium]|nr:sulfite oxidase [Candidatus Saccharimonadales bacterium]
MPLAVNRRDMIKGSAAAMALAWANFSLAGGSAAPGIPVPFLDPLPVPADRPMLSLDQLPAWTTPLPDFFAVNHYGAATIDAAQWRLEVTGLVKRPKSFSLEDLKSRHHAEITATLECSGNGSAKTFMGAVGNARWGGAPLGRLLKECGLKSQGIEVVFFGADEKTEKIKGHDYLQNFGRSLSVTDALRDKILLAYEMNGKPLEPKHGFPLRLIVPGWYGIAWVKWLKRIEIRDRRFMGRFMARDYVTIRGEERPDGMVWRETSVTRLNVKSIVAAAMRRPNGTVTISGMAWSDGTPLRSVELKIDEGPWLPARIDHSQHSQYAWSFWNYEWQNPSAGEHTLVSRATDAKGTIQPSADDPLIKLKKTYYEANEQYPRKIRI